MLLFPTRCLYYVQVVLPTSGFECYAMAVFNGPLHEVLSYILCHDLPDAYTEYAKMHQRYKFSHTDLQALQRQRQSLLSSGSCGFIEWCSGRITGSALRKLAALLVE